MMRHMEHEVVQVAYSDVMFFLARKWMGVTIRVLRYAP